MLKTHSLAALASLILATVIATTPIALVADDTKPLALIPWPVQVDRLPGEFEIKDGTELVVPEGDRAWMSTARVFADKVEERFGVRLSIRGAQASYNTPAIVVITTSEEIPGSEGYKLSIRSRSLNIYARTPHGFHNALMTLLQLIDAKKSAPALPALDLIDYPRFSWRGMLFDPARTFMPPEVIKRYLDILSEFKLNVLHWHLTDDQGWRIESKVFPRLHEIGGVLSSLEPMQKSALDKHGWGRGGRGYYTQDEIREIVAYAQDRHIMVVPEIDVPGHSSAMLAAYPELSCSGETPPIRTGRGIWPTALCPGKEEVYKFLDELFGEVAELFPSPYIHIGSDEVMAGDWLDYPANRELMAARGLKGRAGLQGYFVARVDEILKKHNRTMIGWDEITSYLPQGAVLQAWRRHDPARVAAENGNDAIVSLFRPSYINYSQLFHTMKGIYHFEPIPKDLSPDLSGHILGAEVCLWGHQVTLVNMDKKIFPRVIAHAEGVWSPSGTRDWKNFQERLNMVGRDMEEAGVVFGKTWKDPLGFFTQRRKVRKD